MGLLMGALLPPSALKGMRTVQVGRSPNTEEGIASQTGRLLMQRGPDWPLLAPSLSPSANAFSDIHTELRTSTLTQKKNIQSPTKLRHHLAISMSASFTCKTDAV